jgi:hypothetical protein
MSPAQFWFIMILLIAATPSLAGNDDMFIQQKQAKLKLHVACTVSVYYDTSC